MRPEDQKVRLAIPINVCNCCSPDKGALGCSEWETRRRPLCKRPVAVAKKRHISSSSYNQKIQFAVIIEITYVYMQRYLDC